MADCLLSSWHRGARLVDAALCVTCLPSCVITRTLQCCEIFIRQREVRHVRTRKQQLKDAAEGSRALLI